MYDTKLEIAKAVAELTMETGLPVQEYIEKAKELYVLMRNKNKNE